MHSLVGNVPIADTDRVFDQISAVIDFRYNPVGTKLAVGINRPIAPDVRRQAATQVAEHVGVAIDAPARDHDTGFIGILAAGGGRIDRHYDPRHVRRLPDAGSFYQLTRPKRSFHVVEQLRIQFLAAQPRTFITID